VLREAKQNHGNFPVESVVSRRQSTATRDSRKLLDIVSQVAWQSDLDVAQSLSPVLICNSCRQSHDVADDDIFSTDRV